MDAREFGLGEILTVTTECLVARSGMDGVYDILNYITGDSVYTHQIPRVLRECRPWILRQHPQLEAVGIPAWADIDAMWAWLSGLEAKYGATLPIHPIPADDHAQRDPAKELEDMVGGRKVIAIDQDCPCTECRCTNQAFAGGICRDCEAGSHNR